MYEFLLYILYFMSIFSRPVWQIPYINPAEYSQQQHGQSSSTPLSSPYHSHTSLSDQAAPKCGTEPGQ